MFICQTTYQRYPLPNDLVVAHWSYLDESYARGELVCSGPQYSGMGGVLVLQVRSETDAHSLLAGDPLVEAGLVTYTLVGFCATRAQHPDMVDRRSEPHEYAQTQPD